RRAQHGSGLRAAAAGTARLAGALTGPKIRGDGSDGERHHPEEDNRGNEHQPFKGIEAEQSTVVRNARGHHAPPRVHPRRARFWQKRAARLWPRSASVVARWPDAGSAMAVARLHRYLAVNFREVVHSVRTGNADVAKP